MQTTMRQAVFLLLAVATVALHGSEPAASDAQALSAITVAPGDLPRGCSLTPLVARAKDQPRPPVSFPSNPWVGTGQELSRLVRSSFASFLPGFIDAPRSVREATALQARLYADVVEAYHAEYETAAGRTVEVAALRFKDPSLAGEPPPGSVGAHHDRAVRIVRGATSVSITGDESTDCFKAIAGHIRAIR